MDRIIPIGEMHLRHAVYEYVEHYHRERNLQGMGNQLLEFNESDLPVGRIECDDLVTIKRSSFTHQRSKRSNRCRLTERTFDCEVTICFQIVTECFVLLPPLFSFY